MHRFFFSLFVLLAGALTIAPLGQAATIFSLSPVTANTTPGGTITFDLLANSAKLGGYDLDVNFDPLLLSLTDVQFGPYLGVSSESVTYLGLDSFNLFGISFSDPVDLDALQPTGSFRVATLTFLAANVANKAQTAISITRADYTGLSGGFFSDNSPAGALLHINPVQPPPSNVPEPSALALLAPAAAGMAFVVYRKRSAV